jgi:hypothetical protein
MYNITITVSSDQDISSVAEQIAHIIERATGQRCRVSVVNRKPAKDYLYKLRTEAIEKLRMQERPELE